MAYLGWTAGTIIMVLACEASHQQYPYASQIIFWPHIDSQQACTPRLQSTSLPARACVCLEYLPYIGIITVGAIAMATATFKEQRWYEADGRKVHTNNLQESVLGSVTDKRLRLQALKQITHHSACVVTRYPHKYGQRTEG